MSVFHINLEKYFPERYDLAKFLNFEEGAFNCLTSDFLHNLKNIPQSGEFKIVTNAERPDQIAALIYGEVQYWWVIMFYNDIFDVKDLKEGLTLKYPSLGDLEDFYFSLKQREQTK